MSNSEHWSQTKTDQGIDQFLFDWRENMAAGMQFLFFLGLSVLLTGKCFFCVCLNSMADQVNVMS